MGQQHLITRAIAVTAVAFVLAACSPGAEPRSAQNAGPRHVQFVPAMKSAARLDLVKRFIERNGPEWTVNREALLGSTIVLDPFVGFLRRANKRRLDGPVATPVSEEEAELTARAFVRKNADLLGIPLSKLLLLQGSTEVAEKDARKVRLEAEYPTKGYESFHELENTIAIDVLVDVDGTVSSFVNTSKIHPRLAIDTKPGLPSSDWRVYEKVVGRRVFAMTDFGQRIELGKIEYADLLDARLAMQVSPGPLDAWLTYRLTWLVPAARKSPGSPSFFFFFYLVDTDTTDVVQDSPVPTEETDLFDD